MRRVVLIAALGATPFLVGCGVYYGAGPSLAPYQGRSLHGRAHYQLGYAPSRWPHWTAALAGSAAQADLAAFVEPKCNCRLKIVENTNALDVQYRWRLAGQLHPVLSVAVGDLRAGYLYGVRLDSAQTVRFVNVGGGGELSLASLLHVTLLAGYRQSFGSTRLKVTASHSGFVMTSQLIVGRRYRAR